MFVAGAVVRNTISSLAKLPIVPTIVTVVVTDSMRQLRMVPVWMTMKEEESIKES